MQRTNSHFVILKAGFFRDSAKNLYMTKPGFYTISECLIQERESENKRLRIPENGVVLIGRPTPN